ncbi:hypothetical protein WR25_19532 isoform C [Diploscapter pachys]|uniref:Triokinase/FMN cyclase n=1 Tax=Diploscapter pachys TaxID=2018661 RepID=A0A2A2M1I9_9BILA|nr:hypothetical protein WR25_19532 isoform C [Diploscapter pachys]
MKQLLFKPYYFAGTFGVSLYPCSLPGKGPMFRLEEDEMEVGLGIHGESGRRRESAKSAREVATDLMKDISECLRLKKDEPICVLLNNLGSVSQLEMNILAAEIIQWARNAEFVIKRFYSGTFLTSLDGHGISITILRVYDENLLAYLDAPTNAPAWRPSTVTEVDYTKLDLKTKEEEKQVKETDEMKDANPTADGNLVERMMESVCEEMKKREDELNRLDGAAGDADCGSTFASAAKAIYNAKDKLDFAHPYRLLRQVSEIFEESVGGTSGAIYALMLSTASTEFKESVSKESCISALKQANEAVQKYGGARPGDRSMVCIDFLLHTK